MMTSLASLRTPTSVPSTRRVSPPRLISLPARIRAAGEKTENFVWDMRLAHMVIRAFAGGLFACAGAAGSAGASVSACSSLWNNPSARRALFAPAKADRIPLRAFRPFLLPRVHVVSRLLNQVVSIAAGPPTTCKTAGVYSQCGGCEEPPSADAVDSQRYWDEFTVFQGKEGYEGCYKDAAKTFEALGRMDGFDFMFNYRFS